jgi:hypothetical protein
MRGKESPISSKLNNRLFNHRQSPLALGMGFRAESVGPGPGPQLSNLAKRFYSRSPVWAELDSEDHLRNRNLPSEEHGPTVIFNVTVRGLRLSTRTSPPGTLQQSPWPGRHYWVIPDESDVVFGKGEKTKKVANPEAGQMAVQWVLGDRRLFGPDSGSETPPGGPGIRGGHVRR